jgi:hypothetical protein
MQIPLPRLSASHCPLRILRVGKPFLLNNIYFVAEYKSEKD